MVELLGKFVGRAVVKGLTEATAIKLQLAMAIASMGGGLWLAKREYDRAVESCEIMEDRFDELCSKLEQGDPVELEQLVTAARIVPRQHDVN